VRGRGGRLSRRGRPRARGRHGRRGWTRPAPAARTRPPT
jgi:hypothetical protein